MICLTAMDAIVPHGTQRNSAAIYKTPGGEDGFE